MANELRHKATASTNNLYSTDWVDTTSHIFNSQAKGDILYASSASQLSRLAIGSNNDFLVISGGIPSWTNTIPDFSFLTGQISFGDGAGSEEVRFYHAAGGGSLTIFSYTDSVRTSLDLGPTRGTLPTSHALTELVIYRTVDQGTNFARFNITAHTDGTYHISQEYGGTESAHDICFRTEDGVTAGTEKYLFIDATRVGDAQPIVLNYAHLRFDQASMGASAAAYYIARGGGNSLSMNVPTGATLAFLVNNTSVLGLTGSTATWGNITHTGLKLSGALDADGQAITGHAQAITDNALLTVDDSPNDDEFARFTADGIEGLTVAEAITALFGAALPENVSIILDPVLSADGKWSGIVEAGTAGATLTFGEVCYFKAADSEWYEAKADATATSGAVKIGICVVAGTDGNACTMLRYGKIKADAIFPTFTISAPVFISAATAGLLTSTAPTGTEDFVVRIVGHANTGDEIAFEPDNSYIELAAP
ncbi:MAG: hypothetical protein NWE89_17430 [Candidatus Bathyarchaeota archaeon]|nr:hypothetical protein [Candidatus Bathyarchaeota archaeon]